MIIFFYLSIVDLMISSIYGKFFLIIIKILFILDSLKANNTKELYIETLIMAFPINVAVKNYKNGTWKWPQHIPAKSNKGFGIDAPNKTVMNA